jgi:hypothetical protein
MRFEQVKGWFRALLIRTTLVLAGVILVGLSLSINRNAGHAVLAGLFSPDSPWAIVISAARLLLPAAGLGLIYRGFSKRTKSSRL